MRARRIHVNGIVQGVGFRPHVVRLARELECTGWVLNGTAGVDIFIEHEDARVLDRFAERLAAEKPGPAVISSIEVFEARARGLGAFTIESSERDGEADTLVSPDLATCDDCLSELFDADDRRYRYPFINCTNCGPRFTIIDDLPYDREATSMRAFDMCPSCAEEYGNDADRRYHAQPDACFECGPRLWLVEAGEHDGASFVDGELLVSPPHIDRTMSDALIDEACKKLRAGGILAIKGLGGWHLACDACNEAAVLTLRQRKLRPTKPLAVMMRDLQMADGFASIDDAQAGLLASPARPIVLAERKTSAPIARSVCGDLDELGVMLPATPLQHLIMHSIDFPLVMTSANRSGEPIVASDEDAIALLSSVADAFLGNNRKIVARFDDSVARITRAGDVQMVRRARGYSPSPVRIAAPSIVSHAPVHVLATGSEQKSTFCLVKGDRAFVSQHIGDLENLGAWKAYEQAFHAYRKLFDMDPRAIACDMHPEYIAGKWARRFAAENGLQLIEIQHHHAHIASVMGENGLDGPVIGIALDGTGYGTDGTIWGGEILIATRKDFDRFWHLPAFKLPGGAAAIKDPRRTAYSVIKSYGALDGELFDLFSPDDPLVSRFLDSLENRELYDQMMEKDINSPLCTSAGRLFDAVSALLGVCASPTYDGEAASLLEASIPKEADITSPLTAKKFHEVLINVIIERTLQAREETGSNRVALSGGCMVNRTLFEGLRDGLSRKGFEVHSNRELPPNDGCISYGQAVVARARLEE